MLIGLCGGICAGKHAIAEYLIEHQGFQLLELTNNDHAQSADSEDDLRLQASEIRKKGNSHNPEFTFQDAESLLDFTTKRWQERWITTDIADATTLDRLLLRPFFLLVSVDAPVSLRWKRFADRCWRRQLDPPDLEKFVLWNDHNLYDKGIGRVYLTDKAQVRLFNSTSSLEELHSALETLDLADEQRLRPSWDQYFMQLASLAAQRSNCMKRRVGCVLVRESRVISTGYNGTPRHLQNCNQGGCPRCNRGDGGGVGLSTCLCLHAEENALLEAGRERIREGAILYCDTCPCLTCTVKIAQVGISEVVYSQGYNMDSDVRQFMIVLGVLTSNLTIRVLLFCKRRASDYDNSTRLQMGLSIFRHLGSQPKGKTSQLRMAKTGIPPREEIIDLEKNPCHKFDCKTLGHSDQESPDKGEMRERGIGKFCRRCGVLDL